MGTSERFPSEQVTFRRRPPAALLVAHLMTHRVTFYFPSIRLSRRRARHRDPSLPKDGRSDPASPGDQHPDLLVDVLLAIDDRSFLVDGWFSEADAQVTRLSATSPDGDQVQLLETLFRYPRPDVVAAHPEIMGPDAATGFISFFMFAQPTRAANGWLLETEKTIGRVTKVKAPPPVRDVLAARDAVLARLVHERPDRDELIQNHLHPAISRIHERSAATAKIDSVLGYGQGPSRADVSVVVPLCGTVDLLERQLAELALDPTMRDAELIYVLDRALNAYDVPERAAELFGIYGIPFRLVLVEKGAGYPLATNLGVSLARGRLLLLLHADVLPDKPGWLHELASIYDSTSGIGALGPKLVFEDDTLEHAGMAFWRRPGSVAWECVDALRGLHRTISAAGQTRRVPVLSSACLLTTAERYRRCGGFRGIYISPTYEAADLCLRLMQAGLHNRYVSDVALYHLQEPSTSTTAAGLARRYDAWLLTRQWEDQIEASSSAKHGHDDAFTNLHQQGADMQEIDRGVRKPDDRA